MYQTIHEPIAVVGSYARGTFTPRKFLWRHRQYPISQITLRSDVKDGGVRYRIYSVLANQELYRLSFDRDNEQWELTELWVE